MSFPSRRHVSSLLLNTKHLGSLRNTLYLSILSPWRSLSSFDGISPRRSLSPLRRKVISFDALSLSPNDKLLCSFSPPLTSISKKGLLESVEWVWSLRHRTKQWWKCNACRGQDSLSGAGSEETQNMWQRVFPVMKSVAPSGMLRSYRKDSVGPKITNRCNRVHRRENTCHLSSLD